MDNKITLYEILFTPYLFYSKLSSQAYSNYLENKFYVHALCIFEANKLIVEHFNNHAGLIPDELVDDVARLVNHYTIWMSQFRIYEKKKNFNSNDQFVFNHVDDLSAFPKDSVNRIFNYCEKLKNKN